MKFIKLTSDNMCVMCRETILSGEVAIYDVTYSDKGFMHNAPHDCFYWSIGKVIEAVEKNTKMLQMIEDEELTIEAAKKEYAFLWEEFKRKLPLVSDSDILKMVNVTLGVCPYCHDAPRGCQCWNDE